MTNDSNVVFAHVVATKAKAAHAADKIQTWKR